MESSEKPTSVAEPPSEGWSEDELAHDPHGHDAKADKVRTMFGAIARSYDINNRIHSFGRDQAWRRAAVRRAEVKSTDHVLDCACGTGDLTRAFADAGAKRVVGLDYTPEMLSIARTKRLGPDGGDETISYLNGDAQNLPFDDASFDVVSIAFGIRNVADPRRAIREFRRVLRPGGRLVILEFSEPRSKVIRFFHGLYTKRIMPFTATMISRDRSGAYRYLPRSVETFLDRDDLAGALEDAGFKDVRQTAMTFGVCICYRGVVSDA